mgnify:CR=1 FL=1
MTLEVSLVIGSFVTLLFFITGILIGWTAREYMKKRKSHWDIFPEELFQGLKVILYITFGGIALFYGGWNFPYPTAIVVMVVSVGFLVWTRKWFE